MASADAGTLDRAAQSIEPLLGHGQAGATHIAPAGGREDGLRWLGKLGRQCRHGHGVVDVLFETAASADRVIDIDQDRAGDVNRLHRPERAGVDRAAGEQTFHVAPPHGRSSQKASLSRTPGLKPAEDDTLHQ